MSCPRWGSRTPCWIKPGEGAEGDPDDRFKRLFAAQSGSADAGQRASVERWQGRDRYYERVQDAAAGDESATDEALRVMSHLQEMASPLPEDVHTWRGIRSVEQTFGTGVGDLRGRDAQIVRRFMSTTMFGHIARDEFTRPGKGGALLKVTALAGAAAVWLPPIGDPQLSYQGELLFRPGFLLRIVERRRVCRRAGD